MRSLETRPPPASPGHWPGWLTGRHGYGVLCSSRVQRSRMGWMPPFGFWPHSLEEVATVSAHALIPTVGPWMLSAICCSGCLFPFQFEKRAPAGPLAAGAPSSHLTHTTGSSALSDGENFPLRTGMSQPAWSGGPWQPRIISFVRPLLSYILQSAPVCLPTAAAEYCQ